MMGAHKCKCGGHMSGMGGCCEPWFLMTKEERIEKLKGLKKMFEMKLERIEKVLKELEN